MAAYRNYSKNRGKMIVQPFFNRISPWAHTKLVFDMLGVARKFIKYIVHSSKTLKYYFISYKVLKHQTTNFYFKG
jgi:hypothetical protein